MSPSPGRSDSQKKHPLRKETETLASLRSILRAAVAAGDPEQAVRRFLRRDRNRLEVGKRLFDLESVRRIHVIGAGKAAVPMAIGLEKILGDRITSGLVVKPHPALSGPGRIRLLPAGHPIPDRAGLKASAECLRLADAAASGDLVFVLLSGGASALLPAPVRGVSLRDKQVVTDRLLKSGARIDEINTVRKHLSEIKGGRLAARIHPADSVALILSDVVSGDPSVIASGPTVPDRSRFIDAIEILGRYELWDRTPEGVRRQLMKGRRGGVPETPKPGDRVFEKACSFIIADNRLAVQSAEAQAKALGFEVRVLTTTLEASAGEAGRLFGAIAREIHQSGRPIQRPACLIAGGELTVTVDDGYGGRGLGGRAQEFALSAALEIEGIPGTMIAGFATDGVDGPTPAAGAWADGTTMERARKKRLDPRKSLARHDSHPFFKALGDLLLTGPTGTNLNDLYLLLMP